MALIVATGSFDDNCQFQGGGVNVGGTLIPNVTISAQSNGQGEIVVEINPTPFTKIPQVAVTPHVPPNQTNHAMSLINISKGGFSIFCTTLASYPATIGFDFTASQP